MSIAARRLNRAANPPQDGGSTPVEPIGENILIGKNSIESDVVDSKSEPGNYLSHITDGNPETRWISQPVSPVNVTIDMEGVYDLSAVSIIFAADTIKGYEVSISSDGTDWSVMATDTTDGTSLSQEIIHDDLSGNTEGRYLRITGINRWNSAWGNSIWEVKAYGELKEEVAHGAITNFTATVASDTAINLAWAYSGSTLEDYTLKRNNTVIATIPAGTTTYSDTGLDEGTPYAYSLVGNLDTGGTTNTAGTTTTTSGGAAPEPTGSWLSGASCRGAAQGTFGAWRGKPITASSSWSDGNWHNMRSLWQLNPDASGDHAYYNYSGTLDLAPGAIYDGMTWGQAAGGAADDHWRTFWQTLKTKWTRIPRGNVYVRFAHEMNGNWYKWSVNSSNIQNFKNGWVRFYNLKQEIFPQAKLAFGTVGETTGQNYDWRALWPGDQYVDVYSVDWYANHWAKSVLNGQHTDSKGGPRGLLQHRQFALEHGKPIVISEWAVNKQWGGGGDRPDYIEYVHNFCQTHAGTGAGNLLYECYFNLTSGYEAADHQIFYPGRGDSTTNPNAAQRYRTLF